MDPISLVGARRNEDIALDLMKFIAATTGYGKSTGPAGFSGGPGKADDDTTQLLELYTRCLTAVNGKK